MPISSFTKATIFCRFSSAQFFSTVSPKISQFRNRISLANLLQRYGFSPSQLHTFHAKNHFLLDHSNVHEIKNSLNIISSFRISQTSFISLLFDCPAVLDFDFLKNWQIGISKFGNSGVSPVAICSVLALSKRFQIDPGLFLNRVGVLKDLGFNGGVLTRVVERFPRIIMMKEDEICRKIGFWEGTGISRYEIERVFHSFPEVLGFDVENRLKPLLDEFLELGFRENEIRDEITRDPRVLGMELGEMSRCLGLLKTLKCRVPTKDEIFSEGEFRAGFEVKLRVNCLCKQGLIHREAFKSLIKPSRLRFYNLYVKPYPECEKMFGRIADGAALQQRHPVRMWKHFKPQKHTDSKEDVNHMKYFMEPLV